MIILQLPNIISIGIPCVKNYYTWKFRCQNRRVNMKVLDKFSAYIVESSSVLIFKTWAYCYFWLSLWSSRKDITYCFDRKTFLVAPWLSSFLVLLFPFLSFFLFETAKLIPSVSGELLQNTTNIITKWKKLLKYYLADMDEEVRKLFNTFSWWT